MNSQEVVRRSYQEKMVQDAARLSVGDFFSRVFGLLYIIPWYASMGEQGRAANSLFSMGATFYTLFLLLATAGIPWAMAKQVAKYNALSEYHISWQLFLRTLQLVLLLGVLVGGVMFVSAPIVSEWSGAGQRLVPIFRSLAVAVFLFPCMSVLRGYFQGSQMMRLVTISRVVAQGISALYMVLSAFVVMKLFQGAYTAAVVQATVALSIGTLASYGILVFYLMKDRERRKIQAGYSLNKTSVKIGKSMLEILQEARPLALLGLGLVAYKVIDQFTFIRTMAAHTNYNKEQLLDLYALFSANPDRVALVIVAAALAASLKRLAPLLTFQAQKDGKKLAKAVNIQLQTCAYLVFPLVMVLVLLAYPLNTVLYTADMLGGQVLIVACLAGGLLGFLLVISAMLQVLSSYRVLFYSWLAGILVKFVVQIPLIRVLEVYGPLFATILGLGLTCGLALSCLRDAASASFRLSFRRSFLIFVLALFSLFVAFCARQLCFLVWHPENRMEAFMTCLVTMSVGGLSYLYITLKIRLADKLIGKKALHWRRKLWIK